ncbi:prepilin peptidase [Streptomyces reniochalinae]|uniref:Prepilin peptidase n=1 Tax=Streptomyces reniochalinae TaxID=2250578 RepID=A0A367EYR9_9ACTN|nr:A24 family peptidase [Streptomyces reniochalinae]RCG22695.1 prepilin peptidase [Streptomyces reniochalinae]
MPLEWIAIVAAAVYGAAAGAVLPRAAYRLSVEPGAPWRDSCPRGHPLGGGVRAVLGPAVCGACARAEEPQRPYRGGREALALVGAVVCAGLAAAVGVRPELAVWLLCAPFALLLAAVDLAVMRLPDLLTLPLAAGTAALLGLAALLPGAGGSWRRALLGGLVLAGAFFVLFVISPRAVAFGDVKLALSVGVALGWYGWAVLFAGAFLGFLSAAGYGVALMVTGRARRGSALAFGPFMVLGAAAGVALGGLAA